MEKFANDLGIFFALEYFGTTHPGRKEHTFTGHLLPSDDMSDGFIKFSNPPRTLQKTYKKFSFLNKELSSNNNNTKRE